jgi:hypothetical protein
MGVAALLQPLDPRRRITQIAVVRALGRPAQLLADSGQTRDLACARTAFLTVTENDVTS